ncbi:hypothetical protein CPT_phageK_gp079 [Staphylococcus phage phiSA039]|nr:hypothetical protein CPT_phageK_gp079 [Staphylococcus phage phiSA039]
MNGIIVFYKEENKHILKKLLEFINTTSKGLTYTLEGTLVDNDIVLLEDNNMCDYNLRQFSKTNDGLVVGLLSESYNDVHYYEKGDAYGIERLTMYLEEMSQ